MKLIYLKSALKYDSFDVNIGVKIPFFRVSVTIERGHSLLTVGYHELFNRIKVMFAHLLTNKSIYHPSMRHS